MKIGPTDSEAEVQACFDIRRAVFIEEQEIPEAEEWDEADGTCLHFLASDPVALATARLIDVGDGMAKIGRIAVMKSARGTGLGARIVTVVEDHARATGFVTATLEAQVYAIPFYERLGYIAEGPEFDDGSGIMHRTMTKRLQNE